MEYSNEHFLKLIDKRKTALKNAGYFHMLREEYSETEKDFSYTMYRRAERILDCLNYWEWDRYKKNKILKLRKVSRCKDMFCPNCRKVNVDKAIINFSTAFRRMLIFEYHPYLMTLTVPNVSSDMLTEEINKMNKAFVKFWRWLYKPFTKNGSYYGGHKDRIFDAVGAIKVLEVNVQKNNSNMFHPHFHILVFLENDFPFDFIKNIPGGYQYKSDSYIYYSEADIFVQKLWKMAYDYKSIDNYGNASSDWQDNFICDIRELVMPKGIYEVFKYCFKDNDIKNYKVFKTLFFSLRNRRIRQGYGELYNVEVDDWGDFSDDCIENYLEYKDEEPEVIVNNCISDMTEKYRDYKKVSIYKEKR